jgi:hypothetical protein
MMTLDNPTSSAHTQQLLGCKPTHSGLLAGVDAGYYFTPAAAAVSGL